MQSVDFRPMQDNDLWLILKHARPVF